MKKTVYIIIFLAIGVASCTKTYVCECKNANATYIAGEKDGTRHQAKNYCESLSSNDTKCNIQQ